MQHIDTTIASVPRLSTLIGAMNRPVPCRAIAGFMRINQSTYRAIAVHFATRNTHHDALACESLPLP
ncbi:hypothetical protein [Burkholderia pyrrocinia]